MANKEYSYLSNRPTQGRFIR